MSRDGDRSAADRGDAPTVVVGQVEHETNTFSPLTTGMDEFAAASLHRGAAVVDDLGGTNTAVGGFLRVAEREGWDVVPTVAADATPGGPVTADALRTLAAAVVEGVERADPDGVLLALHGAMVSEAARDGDGYVLERVREAAGPDVPVVASLDLHANVSGRMVRHADGLVGYRTYPHVDIGDTGERAARVLAATLAGDLDPTVVVERAPLLPPLPPLRTATEPMRSLVGAAETADAPFDATVFGGFAYADVDHAGVSVVGVADRSRAADAREACRRLATEAYDRRAEFDRSYTGVADAAAEAAAWDAAAEGGPLVLADVSDNPGGGGAQDGTALLEALLAAGVTDAALATVYDPTAVERAVAAGVGERVSVSLGGHTGGGDPLDLTARVRLLSDGRYRNHGPMSTGLAVSFGRTAVLEVDGVDVLVGSHRQQPYDPEAFRSQGIAPERRSTLVLKSTVHYRAAFEPLAGGVREVGTPGLCSPDLSSFSYERVRRPRYPLDTDVPREPT